MTKYISYLPCMVCDSNAWKSTDSGDLECSLCGVIDATPNTTFGVPLEL